MSTAAVSVDAELVKNPGWRVAFAAMGINLALGGLYGWSVISKAVPAEWGWSESDKSWPYSIACLMFALTMVPAGRMQDKIGPKVVATIGGMLVGAGLIVASTTTTALGYMVGFGLLAGAGIGFGYASAMPPAVKWFPKGKTGLIAGIVVSGFGLASVYYAPLANELITRFGIPNTMLIFGVGFLLLIVGIKPFFTIFYNGLAGMLEVPPKGYVPIQPSSTAGVREAANSVVAAGPGTVKKEEFTTAEMLRTWQFYLIWGTYACGAGAGLMIISKLAAIAKLQAAVELGFVLVAVLALGNGSGRVLAGFISDKIGRKATLLICFVLQAALISILSQATAGTALAQPAVLAIIAALIGANFGANLALFPAVTKDFYGLKSFGMNYGFVFTAFGVGGFMLSLFAGMVYDGKIVEAWKGSFNFAYFTAAGLLIAAAVVVSFLKAPQRHVNPTTD